MTTYQQDMGAESTITTYDLFIGLSSCFTLLCILGGWMNLYFKENLNQNLWKRNAIGSMFRIQVIYHDVLLLHFTTYRTDRLIFLAATFSWFYPINHLSLINPIILNHNNIFYFLNFL